MKMPLSVFMRKKNFSCEIAQTNLAGLYAEFAQEDRELAEEGMSEYVEALTKEDVHKSEGQTNDFLWQR